MSNIGSEKNPLTDGRLLLNNIAWNVIGTASPLVFAILSIPILIRVLGVDRFGVLSLVWMLVGYFSLFDFGIGRALTKLVSERLAVNDRIEVSSLTCTALSLMLILGFVGSIVLVCLAATIAGDLLKIPDSIRAEAQSSVFYLALAIPIVTTTSGLRGLLEAAQRFRVLNAIRVPTGALTFIVPLMVVPFSIDLGAITLALLGLRFVSLVAHGSACWVFVPEVRGRFSIRLEHVISMLTQGGWITVTNVVGPLMIYLDRFAVGAYLSVAAVTYYVTPFEVVTKLLLLPTALMGVLFPAFSAILVQSKEAIAELYWRGVKTVFLGLFPVILVVTGFALEGLALWIDKEFAERSYLVLQWLALGVLVNGIASVPFALIQSAGRSDITAKLHLVELPLYFCLLVYLLSGNSGIEGIAIAWTVRVIADAICLFFLAIKVVPESASVNWRNAALYAIFCFVSVGVVSQISEFGARVIFVTVVIIVAACVAWTRLLNTDERKALFSIRL